MNGYELEDRPLLLDTNMFLILARDGRPALSLEARFGLAVRDDPPKYSIVAEGELRSLALQFHWGTGRIERMNRMLARMDRVSLELAGVIDNYALIDDYSLRHQRKMGKNDLWIAPTTRALGAALLTSDRDFDHLDPLFINRLWLDPR